MLIIYISKNSWWDSRKARKVLLPLAVSKIEGHACILVNAAFPFWLRFPHLRHWQDPENQFYVFTPFRFLPFQRFQWVRWFNQNMQLSEIISVLKYLNKMRQKRFCFIISDPEHVCLAKSIRARGWKCYYDWTEKWDDYAISEGFKSQQKIKNMNDILDNADGVIAVSRALQKETVSRNIPCLYLPNAVSDEFTESLGKSEKEPYPSVLNKSHFPRVAHVGSTNPEWIEWDYVIAAAEANPGVSFSMIGGSAVNRVLPSNVFMHGLIPYDKLASVMAHMQVFMILYKPEQTAGGDPTKLYEYLATGKPVVATPHPRCLELRNLVSVAHTSREFVLMIRQALWENDQVLKQKRKQYAYNQRWALRAEQLLEWTEKD